MSFFSTETIRRGVTVRARTFGALMTHLTSDDELFRIHNNIISLLCLQMRIRVFVRACVFAIGRTQLSTIVLIFTPMQRFRVSGSTERNVCGHLCVCVCVCVYVRRSLYVAILCCLKYLSRISTWMYTVPTDLVNMRQRSSCLCFTHTHTEREREREREHTHTRRK